MVTILPFVTLADRYICEFMKTCNAVRSDTTLDEFSVHGYKSMDVLYGDYYSFVSLRASDENVVEIESIISHPERKGCGSKTMEKLCTVADNLGVTLWLTALPYGINRQLMPVKKLKALYQRFGFYPVKQVNRQWLCPLHKRFGKHLENLMIRFVEEDESPSKALQGTMADDPSTSLEASEASV